KLHLHCQLLTKNLRITYNGLRRTRPLIGAMTLGFGQIRQSRVDYITQHLEFTCPIFGIYLMLVKIKGAIGGYNMFTEFKKLIFCYSTSPITSIFTHKPQDE